MILRARARFSILFRNIGNLFRQNRCVASFSTSSPPRKKESKPASPQDGHLDRNDLRGGDDRHRHAHPHREHMQGTRHVEVPLKVVRHDQLDRKFHELVSADVSLHAKLKSINAVLHVGAVRGPMVLILGWAGSRSRQLSRYATIHRDLFDSTTVKLTAPIIDLVFTRHHLPPLSQKCLDVMETLLSHAAAIKPESGQLSHSNPVFIHLFSNGGGYVYEKLSRHLHRKSSQNLYPRFRKSLRGTIFDSSPAVMDWEFRCRVWKAKTFSDVGWWGPYLQEFLWFTSGWYIGYFFVNYLIKDPISVPQLYLYSDTDVPTSAVALERYLVERKKTIPQVYSRKFLGSPHVNHLGMYPTEYMETVELFSVDCLSRM